MNDQKDGNGCLKVLGIFLLIFIFFALQRACNEKLGLDDGEWMNESPSKP